jgi:hypothetical protein
MSGKYITVVMCSEIKLSKCDRRVVIQRIKSAKSKQIDITVGKIPALSKMSARAGATDVEMAEPINTGQKGAYSLVISIYYVYSEVELLVSLSFNSQLLSKRNIHIDRRLSETIMLLMPIANDSYDCNVMVYNMTCRAVISLDCSVDSIIKQPRIKLNGNSYEEPWAGYKGIKPALITCTNFTVWECRPLNIRHLINEYIFISWCGRYGE